MTFAGLSPGVYRQVVPPAAPPILETGVVGFVGIAQAQGPTLVTDARQAATVADPAASYLPAALAGFFANGGSKSYVAGAPAATETALGAALDSLAAVDGIDLVAMPDAQRLDPAAVQRLQARMLVHCAANGRRFALLDALGGATATVVKAQAATVIAGLAGAIDGALYHPWITNAAGLSVPPSGHIAGAIAATDASSGVARAPAGMALADVIGLGAAIDPATQGALNDVNVNCLRSLPGRGIRLWGARTLATDPTWRYVNVRRLVLTLYRWMDANMAWAIFEPNTPTTWARIRRVLGVHLTQLWQAGALQGASAAQAFFVTCDASNNPQDARANGQLAVDIGIAPASPAEFIVVRLALQPDAAS